MKKLLLFIAIAGSLNNFSQIHWHLASTSIPAAYVAVDLEATTNNDLYVLCQALEFGEPFTKILKSTNSGVTWTEIANNIPKGNPQAMVISGGKMIVAVFSTGDLALYSSSDFGSTFTKIATAPQNTDPKAQLLTTPSGDVYLVEKQEVNNIVSPLIYKSADNGQTWNSVNIVTDFSSHFPLELFYTNGRFLFTTDYFTNSPPKFTWFMYYSTDGGLNWNYTGAGLISYSGMFVNTPIGIFGFSGDFNNPQMVRSTDDGDNWTAFGYSGATEMQTPIDLVYADGAMVLLAQGIDNKRPVVYRSVSPSGVTDNSANSIRLYPSPAMDFITLEGFDESCRPQSAKVISAEGRIVKQVESNFDKLETAGLLPGVYVLKITTSTGEESHVRFVKASQ